MSTHKTEKILVTDEMLQKEMAGGGTFSSEYWRSLTENQRAELEAGRRRQLDFLFVKVKGNETRLGIHDVMNEYRALRLRRIAGREKEIRDLYFAIPDFHFRISSINDLVLLEKFRYNYFLSSRVLEAYYRYQELIDLRTGPKLGTLGLVLLVLLSILIGSHFFEHPQMGWAICGTVIGIIFFDSMLRERSKLQMASDAYLRWENLCGDANPFPIRDTGPYEGVCYDSFAYLFSEEEMRTGLIDPKFRYGVSPY